MIENKSIISKILLAFLVAALICAPVTASEESAADVADEISLQSDELFTAAESILLDTKAIVKDDTVDQDIRDLAKTIHLVSHDLEDIAAGLKEDSAELQTLAVNSDANKVAMEELLGKMQAGAAEYNEKLEAQHENIHDLVFVVPESREDNADAVHDAAHGAEDVCDHLIKNTEVMQGILSGAPAAATSSTSQNTNVVVADVTVEVTEITEHSGELFTSAESILLDTKAIVKDDTVDQNIRDLAKTIHLVSHELEDVAAGLKENSAELQTLAANPSANKDAMKVIIVEMQTSVTEYNDKLEAQHENIHDLVFVAPESHEDNADAVHDTAHAAEKIADHLTEHLGSLSAALDAPAATPATPASGSASGSAESMPTPGFGAFAAICGIFGAVAYVARRE